MFLLLMVVALGGIVTAWGVKQYAVNQRERAIS